MNLSPDTCRQICQRAGIRVAGTTLAQLSDWLAVRCPALSLPDARAYAQWLSDPAHLLQERQAICHVLTSRETYFLRDQGVVDVLRQHILKDAIAHNHTTRQLRLWSVGCATGEEAYTLRILLEEGLPDMARWQVDILGSDIDPVALTQAQSAVYRRWSFRACPQAFMDRYFEPHGSDLQLLSRIQHGVRFERLDIVGDHYPAAGKGMAQADVILCRNVFIYMDHAAIGVALHKLTACLKVGGFLLCGPGELHAHAHPQLKARILAQAFVYQKQGEALHEAPLAALALPTGAQLSKPGLTKRGESGVMTGALAPAWALANRGALTEALALCAALVRAQALSPDVRYLEAVLHFAQGHHAQAREALRQVLYLDPGFAVAYALLNDVHRTDQDRAGAIKACQQGLKALAARAKGEPVAYCTALTVDGLRQHLQEQMDAMLKEPSPHER